MTKQRAEYISCITRTHADFKGKAWCGRAIDAFSFVDIDHAAENGRQEGRLVACPECVTAIEAALSNGHAAEKRHATTNREMLREINRLADRCTTTTGVAYDEALIALLKKVGEIPEHLARLAAEPAATQPLDLAKIRDNYVELCEGLHAIRGDPTKTWQVEMPEDAAIVAQLATASASGPKTEHAIHDAITRALAEAGVKQEVLVGMCIEVGLEAYRDALNRER